MSNSSVTYPLIIGIKTGPDYLYYWMPCNPNRITAKQRRQLEDEFLATPLTERHGPFNSELAANLDAELVLLGPDCVAGFGFLPTIIIDQGARQ